MKTRRILAGLLLTAGIENQAFAVDTCETLIDAYRQKLGTIINPAQATSAPSAAVQETMKLFDQGYEQCRSGQEQQGMATIEQALALLTAQ
jgi:hypothetical protein